MYLRHNMADLYALSSSTLQDIPNVLRAIADQLEAGEYGVVQMGAIVLEDEGGGVRTFGVGGADYYRAIALFHLGIENLLARRGRENMIAP